MLVARTVVGMTLLSWTVDEIAAGRSASAWVGPLIVAIELLYLLALSARVRDVGSSPWWTAGVYGLELGGGLLYGPLALLPPLEVLVRCQAPY